MNEAGNEEDESPLRGVTASTEEKPRGGSVSGTDRST